MSSITSFALPVSTLSSYKHMSKHFFIRSGKYGRLTGAGKTHSSPDLVPMGQALISTLFQRSGRAMHPGFVLQAAQGYTRSHFTFRL